ncbi:MAG TPA: hypothetical protein VIG66_04680 [Noviherbaspirillum sp.]
MLNSHLSLALAVLSAPEEEEEIVRADKILTPDFLASLPMMSVPLVGMSFESFWARLPNHV